jgi:hypothetical protein
MGLAPCNLEPDLSQVDLGGKASRFKAGVRDPTVDNDVELALLPALYVHRTTPASLNPSLHTEGFGLVASGGAVVNDDRHLDCLSRSTPLR